MSVIGLQAGPILEWIQTTSLATTISGSLMLTAVLSSIHLVGMTLVVGSILFSSLRLLGLVLSDRPVGEVTGVTGRVIAFGLTVSVLSGLLLLAPRISAALDNGFFQFKMMSLMAAVAFHVGIFRRVLRRVDASRPLLRFTGAVALVLWFAVAVAGSAFILLE
jgi:hypothetical protein